MEFLPMQNGDYQEAYALWQRCEGIGLSSADSSCAIKAFLERNPGLSFIAREGGRLIGTALCGTDGRRGYLYHLAVDPADRRRGIGEKLAQRCLEALKAAGMEKCHIMVFSSNREGRLFWEKTGWKLREELVLMSADLKPGQGNCPC